MTREATIRSSGNPYQPLLAASLAAAVALSSLWLRFVDNLWVPVAMAVLGLAAFVPAWTARMRGRLDYFEPVHVIGLLYFVEFGLGALWTVEHPEIAYDIHLVPYVPRAALYCALGYLCFLGGYYLPWRGRTAPRTLETVPVGSGFFVAIGGIGAMGYVAQAQIIESVIVGSKLSLVTTTMAQLSPLFLFAWALSWLMVFSGRASRTQRIFVCVFMIPAAAVVLLTHLDDKSLFATIVGVPLMAVWYGRRRLPIKSLVALLLVLIFAIFPFYNTFRRYDPRMAFGARFSRTVEEISAWDSQTYAEHSVRTFQERLALVNSVAVVIRETGRSQPYLMGESILFAPIVAMIPRAIWPDKPVVTIGRDFGVRFYVVNPLLDKVTSVAVTTPGELYWNFGLAGIVVGLAMFGAGVRWLYRLYGETSSLDPVRRAVFMLVIIELAHFGGGFAAEFSGLARTLILLAVIRVLSLRFGLLAEAPAAATETSA